MRGSVVEELSVERPPLFGVFWERFEFVAELLFVELVSVGKCVVAVSAGFSVVRCAFGLLFGVNGVAALVVDPWV